jgi:hypothetical protein
MSRTTTVVAAAGAGAMIAGALSPWATERGILGESSRPGMDYGGVAVILLALLVALLAVVDRPTLTGACALAAALWICIVMYGLPGALLGAGADEVSITWGAYLALAGCLIALGAALARERRLAQAQGAHHAAVVGRPEA